MTGSNVRTYRASSIQEALRMVEQDLGLEAVILQTRQLPHKRWLPWQAAREEVEVTAGIGWNVAPAALVTDNSLSAPIPVPPPTPSENRSDSGPSTPDDDPPATGTCSLEGFEDADGVPPAGPAASFTRMPDDLTSTLTDRLTSLENRLARLDAGEASTGPMIPPELFDLYAELIDSELNEPLARELVFALKRDAPPGELSDPSLCRARLVRMVESDFRGDAAIIPTPGQRRVVALVGPTGVGKTTTIAKLAANFRLRDGVRMGLVTVDTYRIAAVEQLRTYAEIIDLPMRVVTTPMEMKRALDELSDMDLVLIDTAGRSPRDELQIGELKSLLADAQVDEVHLVLSLTASLDFLVSTVDHFASVGTSSVILTKLDETHELGVMLNLARRIGLPVSYLTTGQDVPDDIEPAEPQRLARLVLGHDQPFVTGNGHQENGG